MTSKIQSQLIKTFRNGAIQEVDTNELVVGDVFLIEPGMMVPADSILIQQTENPEEAKSPFIKDSDAEEQPTSKAKKSTGFSKLNDIFKKAQKETKQEKLYIWVNEMDVTGLKFYQKKNSVTL